MRATVLVLALLLALLAIGFGLAALDGSHGPPPEVAAAPPTSEPLTKSELVAVEDAPAAAREGTTAVVHELDPRAVSPRITGTVVDTLGDARLIAVGAVPVPTDGRVRRATETRYADNGSFALLLPSEGEYVIVAVARNRRPTSTVLLVDFDAPERPLELTLDAGLKITGRVLVNGQPLYANGRVHARLEGGPTARIGGHALRWSGSTFEHEKLVASCDDLGVFELGTLGPFEYALDPTGIQNEVASASVRVGSQRVAAHVRAPSRGTIVSLEGVRHEIHVTCAGEVRAGVKLRSDEIYVSGRRIPECTFGEHLAVEVDPAAPVQVELARVGFASQTLVLSGAVPKTHHIDLERTFALARVRVEIECAERGKSREVRATLSPTEGGEPLVSGLRFEDGVATIPEVPEGSYTISVEAPGSSSLFMPAEAHFTVQDARDVHVKLPCELGSKLRVLLPSTAASSVLRVHDLSSGTQTTVVVGSTKKSVDHGPVTAGDYRCTLKVPGYRVAVFDAKLEPGETTEVRPELERE